MPCGWGGSGITGFLSVDEQVIGMIFFLARFDSFFCENSMKKKLLKKIIFILKFHITWGYLFHSYVFIGDLSGIGDLKGCNLKIAFDYCFIRQLGSLIY